jgi:pyrroloquinoline quinone biosynthesis protein B
VGLTALVLGSAAGGSFPQWNCQCPVCRLAWTGDSRVRFRTQASLAVTAGDGRWTLLNASPDLASQIRATPALHPNAAVRGTPIEAVVLTGAEIDQIAGLLHLREAAVFSVFATAQSHDALRRNDMFRALTSVTWRTIVPARAFQLPGGIEAELFPVPGKVPLYLEGDTPDPAVADGGNVGIELRHGGKKLLFVPGAADVDAALSARLAKAGAVLFDGTLFADDEMIRTGTGVKTGRRMGHMPIEGIGGTLQRLAGLKTRKIFIHINNTNPILVDGSPERRRVAAEGWEVAEDGMEIAL